MINNTIWGGYVSFAGNAYTTTSLSGGNTNTVVYQSSTGVSAYVAINSTATKKYLQQISSGAPSWVQVAYADVSGTPTLGTAAALNTGTSTGNVVQYSSSSTITASITGDISGSSGSCTGNAATATTATNIAGGAAGSIPYQAGSGATSLLATSSGVLIGGATPAYTLTPTLTSINLGNTTLNNYTEGTWTPVVSGNGTAGTYTNSASTGNYTRIGRMVCLSGSVSGFSSATGGTGAFIITGLPFAKMASSNPQGACVTQNIIGTVGAFNRTVGFDSGGASSTLAFYDATSTTFTAVPIASVGTTSTFQFSITYFI